MSYALYLLVSATIMIIREFMIYDALHMDDAPSKQSIFLPKTTTMNNDA